MAPSILSDYAEPAHHVATKNGVTKHIKSSLDASKNGVTTHIKQVAPSPSTDDDQELLHPERVAQALHRNGELSGFLTPRTPDLMESDDPVVIVGMGE